MSSPKLYTLSLFYLLGATSLCVQCCPIGGFLLSHELKYSIIQMTTDMGDKSLHLEELF
jgi:hypothetical protein